MTNSIILSHCSISGSNSISPQFCCSGVPGESRLSSRTMFSAIAHCCHMSTISSPSPCNWIFLTCIASLACMFVLSSIYFIYRIVYLVGPQLSLFHARVHCTWYMEQVPALALKQKLQKWSTITYSFLIHDLCGT